MPYNARTGEVIGRLTATDKDVSAGPMRYRVLTLDSSVSVDEITGRGMTYSIEVNEGKGSGEIRLLRALDGTQFVAVDATDSGSPPLSTVTNLKLQPASSVHHVRPMFDRKAYK